MQRTIYLNNKDDLTYLAGCLVHGKYQTKSYENQTNYKDENKENKIKFNIRFMLPNDKNIEEIFAKF